jgi:hypothetical protein
LTDSPFTDSPFTDSPFSDTLISRRGVDDWEGTGAGLARKGVLD